MTRKLAALCTGCIVLGLGSATAQIPPPTYIPETKFSSGQDVVPTFDGWLRNADGTYRWSQSQPGGMLYSVTWDRLVADFGVKA